MEERDLYDENRNLTDLKINKGDNTPQGLYHLTVVVFIENDKGELLLQKRTKAKGSQWALTGGHPKSGEDSVQGILSEIKEELGFEAENADLKLIRSYRTQNSFRDVFYLRKNLDIKSLTIQKDELEDIKWFTTEEIIKLISKKQAFGNYAYEFDYFMEYKKLN